MNPHAMPPDVAAIKYGILWKQPWFIASVLESYRARWAHVRLMASFDRIIRDGLDRSA